MSKKELGTKCEMNANEEQLESPPSAGFLSLKEKILKKIFYYLSFNDLISIGQTCKHFECAAGECYREYYPNELVETTNDGFRIVEEVRVNKKSHKTLQDMLKYMDINYKSPSMDMFRYFITTLSISINNINIYRCIQKECYSIRSLKIKGKIPNGGIACIINHLPLLTKLELDLCEGNEVNNIVHHCVNLEKFIVRYFVRNETLVGPSLVWTTQGYPNLYHVEIYGIKHLLDYRDRFRMFVQFNHIRTFLSDSEDFIGRDLTMYNYFEHNPWSFMGNRRPTYDHRPNVWVEFDLNDLL